MRASIATGRRPFIGRLLGTLLLPISLACGDTNPVPPTSPAAPDQPTPPTTVPQTPAAPGQTTPPSYWELSGDLYLADSSGADLRLLTQGGWPSWSPDGRRIVFHRDGVVRVIDADGANELALGAGQWPTWSPDGRRIAFASADGIRVMNADGTDARPLMSGALRARHIWGVGKPSWSPDGALIVFDEPGAYDFGIDAFIFAMTADGTSQSLLAGGSEYETEPSWSPDGASVVYWSTRYGLGIVARGGGQTVPLNRDQVAPFFARPAWSPDGRAILFNGLPLASAIMTISREGGSGRVLIERGADAAWSPDGRRLAFVRLRAP